MITTYVTMEITDEIVAPLDPKITDALKTERAAIVFIPSFKDNFVRARLIDELLRCGRVVHDSAQEMVFRAALGTYEFHRHGRPVISINERDAWTDAFRSEWHSLRIWIKGECKDPLPVAGR